MTPAVNLQSFQPAANGVFTSCIDDVTPRQKLKDEKALTLERGYSACDQFIADFAKGPRAHCGHLQGAPAVWAHCP
eukprot:436259-Pelagomonas_calceolata.AAC.2